MYNEALDSVNMVLKSEPENVKALYRCGKVYMVKQDYDQAVDYLQRASNLDPDEKVCYYLYSGSLLVLHYITVIRLYMQSCRRL